jgi:hypothetical protein
VKVEVLSVTNLHRILSYLKVFYRRNISDCRKMSEFSGFNAHELLARMRTGSAATSSSTTAGTGGMGAPGAAPPMSSSINGNNFNSGSVGGQPMAAPQQQQSANSSFSQSRNAANNLNTATGLFLQSQIPIDIFKEDPLPKPNPEAAIQVRAFNGPSPSGNLSWYVCVEARAHGNKGGTGKGDQETSGPSCRAQSRK